MQKVQHITLLFLLTITLSSCSLTPVYQRPEAPVAETFPGTPDSETNTKKGTETSLLPSELGWRDTFVEPALQQLITIALQNNRDLREAALNIEAFQAQYRIQRSALFPGVSADGAVVRQRSFNSGGHSTNTNYSSEVGVTAYELDLFCRVRNQKDQALQQYLASEEGLRSTTISLVAEVARAYLTWLADKELLATTEDTRQIEEESFTLIQQRAAAGIASELDLVQARTNLEKVKANLARYRRQVGQDLNALTQLIGSPLPAKLIDQTQTFSEQSPLSLPATRLTSQVLLQRPDIVTAEYELKAANANIGAARAAFFPTISLTGSLGFASYGLSDLFDSNSGTWLFSPAVRLPIFTAGKLKAELDVAKIRKEIYVARYEKTIQTAFREVADALIATSTYRNQLTAQRANLSASQKYYSLPKDRYEQGIDSYLTLLDAQRSLYTARQDYLNLQLAQLVNQVDLYKVLGGGWKEHS